MSAAFPSSAEESKVLLLLAKQYISQVRVPFESLMFTIEWDLLVLLGRWADVLAGNLVFDSLEVKLAKNSMLLGNRVLGHFFCRCLRAWLIELCN